MKMYGKHCAPGTVTTMPRAHSHTAISSVSCTRRPHHHAVRATNQVLLDAMEQLKQTHQRDIKLLQMRFLDGLPVQRLAHHFNTAESTIYAMQREAVERLTETLWQMECAASTTQKALLKERLEPATYVNLIGDRGKNSGQPPAELLIAPGPPWLVSIEGIGGIGKTSIADVLLRQLIEQGTSSEIGWVQRPYDAAQFWGRAPVDYATGLKRGNADRAVVARQLLPNLAHRVRQLIKAYGFYRHGSKRCRT